MRTPVLKPIIAAAGAGALALSMSAAPVFAAPANPNDVSPAVTVTTVTSPANAYRTGAVITIADGNDTFRQSNDRWSCGLLRMEGWVGDTPSKDNRYRAGWAVAVGANYDLPALTLTVPAASSSGLGWTITGATVGSGHSSAGDPDLPAGNDKPAYTPLSDQEQRVNVKIADGGVHIEVPGGVRAGEYFAVELDTALTNPTQAPTIGSTVENSLRVDQVCSAPDASAPARGFSAWGGPGGSEARDEFPVKVNSGGESDGTSGLIALGLGAVVVTSAASYGLRRSKK